MAEPDVAPPAQPPKSVSQKPLVIDWLVQRLDPSNNPSPNRGVTPTRREDTPPTVTASQSAITAVEDADLPASATELSNKQVRMSLSISGFGFFGASSLVIQF